MAEKKPQDHKPKVENISVKIGEGDDVRDVSARRVKVDGIVVTVLDEAMDDFDMLDDLSRLQDGDAGRLPSVARRLFGDEFRVIMDQLRDEAGRIPIEAAAKFIQNVFGALNPNS